MPEENGGKAGDGLNNSPQEIDISQLDAEDKKVFEKSSRKEDAIRQIFIKNYGFTEGDPYLDRLVEREAAHGKMVSKLLRQKIGYRKAANERGNNDNAGEKNNKTGNEDETIKRNRTKAAGQFLNTIKEKYPDLGEVKSVYERVRKNYAEKGDETSESDFIGRMNEAFNKTYPDKAERSIREDERKRMRESDEDVMDFSNVSTTPGGKGNSKPGERRLIKTSGLKPASWYKKDVN